VSQVVGLVPRLDAEQDSSPGVRRAGAKWRSLLGPEEGQSHHEAAT
jgi:hypothetical protein